MADPVTGIITISSIAAASAAAATSTAGVLAISGGTAAFSAFSASQGAKQRNKAIESSQAIAAKQLEEQRSALKTRSERQRKAVLDQSRRIIGSLRAGFEAGGVAGSEGQAIRSVDFATGLNLSTIASNLSGESRAAFFRTQAQITRLGSQRTNPLVSGVSAGIRGFATGLSITTAIDRSLESAAAGAADTADPIATPADTGSRFNLTGGPSPGTGIRIPGSGGVMSAFNPAGIT